MARMRCRGRELQNSEADLEKTSGSRTTDWMSRRTWRHTSASGSGKDVMLLVRIKASQIDPLKVLSELQRLDS
jgi:hypothetical protein